MMQTKTANRGIRFLALLLTLVMLLGMLPAAALAAGTKSAAEPEQETVPSVTVYFSFSHDDQFSVGKDSGEVMALKKITVPYFDLGLYGLEDFYFSSESYGDDGDGLPGSNLDPGTPEFAYGKVTMLHLFLYATEVFYCNVDPEDAGKGYLAESNILGTSVFNISGSVGSSLLNEIWGYDLNLNYYHNYEYPLASEGWGSTSDQILLHDGDVVTLGHFESWSFFNDPSSIFNYLTVGNREVETRVTKGSTALLNAVVAGPNVNGDSGTAQNPMESCPAVFITPADEVPSGDVTTWTYLGDVAADGTFELDTSDLEVGEYIVAVAGQYGTTITEDICSTPGGTRLIVEEAQNYYDGYPFTNITADGNKMSLIDVTEGIILPQDAFYVATQDVQTYQVVVPEGTETVYVTFPEEEIVEYTMGYVCETGEVNWQTPSITMETTENGTVAAIPAAAFTDTGAGIILENSSYNPICGFSFVSGTPTVPGGSESVAVTGVTLDQTKGTIDLSDAEQTITLTAEVAPANASNTRVVWSSSNTDVATVSRGVVKAVAPGNATITVTTRDGGYTAEFQLTVTDVRAPQKDEQGTCLIETADQLKWLAEKVNSGESDLDAKLVADIDLSEVCGPELGSWIPIGNYEVNTEGYKGDFDGQGHTISNLYMNENGETYSGNTYYRGLFGLCQCGSIRNLNLNGTITSNLCYVGGLVGCAGYLDGGETIDNCHVDVDIQASGRFGVAGVAAQLRRSTMTNCSFSGTITSRDLETWTGGLVGYCNRYGSSSISDCLFDGSLTCSAPAKSGYGMGGIVGYNKVSDTTITNCASIGELTTSGATVGGILGGASENTVVTNCYNAASLTTSAGSIVNGVVGACDAETVTVENSYYLNTFAAADIAGGIAKTSAELKAADMAKTLGSGFKSSNGTVNQGYPALSWQEVEEPGIPITEGYTVSTSEGSQIMVGEQTKTTIFVASQKTAYNAYDLTVCYDADKLTYTGINVEDATVTDKDGVLHIVGYGADKTCGTDNLILTFIGKATGEAKVTVTKANIDKSANANTQDAPAATIVDAETVIHVNGYKVELSDDFTGEGTVQPGADYTFTARDKNYDYVIDATMGGEKADVVNHGDGTYTIQDVHGNLVITNTKTAKTYDVTVEGSGAADAAAADKATYLTDYTFRVTQDDKYTYEVSATVAGKAYALTQNENGTYTIAGKSITGDIVITVVKTEKPVTETQINFVGSGSEDVIGGTTQTAPNGTDFIFDVTKADSYDYTVSLDGQELTPDAAGQYTIPGNRLTGEAITVTVEKTAQKTLQVEANEYIKLDGQPIWLVTASGTVSDGAVLAYDGNAMFWSDKYEAYCYLVISDQTADVVKTEAEAQIAEATAEAGSIAYDGDVNKTGFVDVNDAQLTYDLYNAKYDSFETVSMLKFLEADVNGDATVNVNDAAAIIAQITAH